MEKLPGGGAGDVAHTLARAGLSAVPIVGGPAVELFAAIITPPLTKRRDRWLTDLAEALRELEARVDTLQLDRLGNNEAFVTTTLHATEIAIKNHHAEKIAALRNAILNVALNTDPGEDLLLVFLSLVDTLTVLHLKVLDLLDAPATWFERVKAEAPEQMHREGVTEMYAYPTDLVLPQYDDRRFLYEQILKDLYGRGLIESDERKLLAGMRIDKRRYVRFSPQQPSALTQLGKDFMRFISEPQV